jgi:plasmid stabilization system protein ParE
MDFRVDWTSDAAEELRLVWEYVAKDSPSRAAMVARKIVDAADDLAQFPLMGREVPEWQNPDLRERVVYSYRIIYRVRRDRAIILAIVHGARQLPDAIQYR